MDNVVITTKMIVDSMPAKHKFAKLMLGTIAGFAAKELAERAYTAIYRHNWADTVVKCKEVVK